MYKTPSASKVNSRNTALSLRAKKASALLHRQYGSPRHNNKRNPFDELIFIILSLMTTHHSFNRVYKRLKDELKNWDRLLEVSLPTLRKLIKEGGLSDQKARRIKEIAARLKKDFGKVTLTPLKRMDNTTAELYLITLPGVGLKTAKCILMYSLNRQVLPVDTHVWRLAKRLELVDEKTSYTRIHSKLEEIVRPEDRYSFHVNAISHGRTVCQAIKPRCEICCLNRICPYPKRHDIFIGNRKRLKR